MSQETTFFYPNGEKCGLVGVDSRPIPTPILPAAALTAAG